MESLIVRSLNFVELNINAKSDEIPDDLLDFWLVERGVYLTEYSEEWIVFMKAYDKFRSINNTIEYSDLQLMKLFKVWQGLLNLIKTGDLEFQTTRPVPVFSFEKMKGMIWEWDDY